MIRTATLKGGRGRGTAYDLGVHLPDAWPPRADLARTWALVPIRGLETAKTRLAEEMDPEERYELVVVMLRRTLLATRDAPGITGTIVVTMDPEVTAIAQTYGAIGLVERAPGLNPAIVAARSLAMARGATALLVLPIDLPDVSRAAIDQLLALAQRMAASAEEAGLVVLVPDRHWQGTNALVVSPPSVIDPQFGPASRAQHELAARKAGASYVEADGPLTFDVDTPVDLLVAESKIARLVG